MRQFILLIMLVLATTIWATPEGLGTRIHPYLIDSLDDLAWMSDNARFDQTVYYSLECDIDASATTGWNYNFFKFVCEGFVPIGTINEPFQGDFLGNGHTISGLTIRRDTWMGMFGCVEGGHVRDLTLTNIFYSGASNIGGISGYTALYTEWWTEEPSFVNCHVSGTIWTDGGRAGGIVGTCSHCDIAGCTSDVTITSAGGTLYHLGGIAAYVTDDRSSVVNCSFSGNISSTTNPYVGGIAGQCIDGASINNCCNFGSVSGSTYCGGVVGGIDEGNVTSCYNQGGVVAAASNGIGGGIVGYCESSLQMTDCYNTAAISADRDGGLVGLSAGGCNVTDSFWDTTASGQSSTAGGGAGLSTSQMRAITTYLNAGWNLDTVNAGYNVGGGWTINKYDNGGYPALKWQGRLHRPSIQPSGAGNAASPYQIDSPAGLIWVIDQSSSWGSHFSLGADIAIEGVNEWDGGAGATAIGNNSVRFTGMFDGNGHTISGYRSNRGATDWTGFFGYAYGAQIRDLTLTNAFVRGDTFVGGLIGTCNATTVENCTVIGDVRGVLDVGGLAGQTWGAANIIDCNTTINIDAGDRVGGVIGYMQGGAANRCHTDCVIDGDGETGGFAGGVLNSSVIRDCYSEGYLDGPGTNYGGFAGRIQSASVDNCYSRVRVDASNVAGGFVGAVSGATVTGCFWDKDVSRKSASAAGTGLITAQMSDASVFAAAGWDLLGENANGSGEVWGVDNTTNQGYPFFAQDHDDALHQNCAIGAGSTDPVNVPNVDLAIQFDGSQGLTSLQVTQQFTAPAIVGELPVGFTGLYDVWWSITPNNSSAGTYDITFYAGDLDIADFSMLHILKRDNSSLPWVDVTTLGATLVHNPPYITASGLTSFSDFTLGDYDASALPVTLGSFTAVATSEGYALIAWETQSETDMSCYNVYRDTDAAGENLLLATAEPIVAHNAATAQHYSFTDQDVDSGVTYCYWLEAVQLDGSTERFGPATVSIGQGGEGGETPEIPLITTLGANFPNPFNPSTAIEYTLADECAATLAVYNLRGQLVRVLAKGVQSVGEHRVVWDGRDPTGAPAASGVYFYRLTTPERTETRRMLMVK